VRIQSYVWYVSEIRNELLLSRLKFDFMKNFNVMYAKDKFSSNDCKYYVLVEMEVDEPKYIMFKMAGRSVENELKKSVPGYYNLKLKIVNKIVKNQR
jgi:hypothetical protein